jgi:NAD(P)-dependent dehydrogenase (short-subunit alcohol dehydrogenase family)
MDAIAEFLHSDREGAFRRVAELIPQRRVGLPEDVADVVAWLAGPNASYVNGAAISTVPSWCWTPAWSASSLEGGPSS